MSESQAPKSNGKLVINKTDFVMGSVAGAGSGEFHKYRASRRRYVKRKESSRAVRRKRDMEFNLCFCF